jgi:hypothetical protein
MTIVSVPCSLRPLQLGGTIVMTEVARLLVDRPRSLLVSSQLQLAFLIQDGPASRALHVG